MTARRDFQLSSLDLKVLVGELNEALKGCYVSKIYQPNGKTLLFKLSKLGEQAKQLVVEAGRRIHLTRYQVEKPPRPPAFCAALRKHLTNARIEGVEQPDLERIVIFNLVSGRGPYRLVVELFARGNIILLDGSGRIVHALSKRKIGDRSFEKGETYVLPQAGATSKPESVEKLLEGLKAFKGEVVKALTRIYGVGGLYAEEFLARAGVDKGKLSKQVSLEEAEEIFKAALEVFEGLKSPEPTLYRDGDGKPFAVAPFPLKRLENFKAERYPSMNEAVDELFSRAEAEKARAEVEEKARLQLEELRRVAEEQEAALKSMEGKIECLRKTGETIFRNAPILQELLSQVNSLLEGGMSWEELERRVLEARRRGEFPLNLILSLNGKDKRVKVSLEGLEFELELGKSAYENASTYYDEAKRLKGKLSSLRQALEETKAKMAEVEKLVLEVKAKTAEPVRLREKKWYEKFRFFHTSEGFLVVAGKDASSNEALIKRYTEPADLVFHAELPGAPFTVLKTGGRKPSEASIRQAACFAACYSRAWRENLSAIDIYFVKPEQLSKAAPSGQYLPRGSFMVYGERTYLRRVPLRLALAVRLEGEARVEAGPPEAAEGWADLMAIIVPGRKKAKEIVREARGRMVELAPREYREKLLSLPLEELSALIPFGMGELVEVLRVRREAR